MTRSIARMFVPLVGLVLLTAACTSAESSVDPPLEPAASVAPSPSTGDATDPAEPAASEEVELSSGGFEPIGYDGEGTATVVDTLNGIEVRLSDFRVEQGPALRVYLSAARAGSDEGRYDNNFIDLGALEEFRGDQTYLVPSGTDLAVYRSIVIWCADFSVGFVVAPIEVV